MTNHIASHVQPLTGIAISPDVARMVVHWLGHYSRMSTERYGAAPDGLPLVLRSLAEAAADSRRREVSAEDGAAGLPFGYEPEITPDEAADLLGISADLVRWHCRKGNLVSRKVGRQIVIDAQSVREFAARRNERSA